MIDTVSCGVFAVITFGYGLYRVRRGGRGAGGVALVLAAIAIALAVVTFPGDAR
ncbi:hypothetical protein KBX50_04720 [Micromonospora sp. C51]|uniref:hypothetical protein n=1 Tax=Micromonospora sp. C51 TaxID=2824879 RepID=UPI001B3667CD|nr:hypothetical protein [Micromonospora sp. C51]MBQ1047792.1 hypothetical protein [Micromonospora sp. C51]